MYAVSELRDIVHEDYMGDSMRFHICEGSVDGITPLGLMRLVFLVFLEAELAIQNLRKVIF